MIRIIIVAGRFLLYDIDISKSGGDTMEASKLTQKTMFRLLPVQILLASVGMINGIVSSLFAGNFVGVKAMSAVGLYSPVNLAVVAVTVLLVGGATIICGEHIGRNNPAGVQDVFALDMAVSGILAIIVTVGHLIFGLAGSIMPATGDPEVSRLLTMYVLGQAVSIIPLFLGSQLAAFLSLDNKGRLATTAGLVYIGLNFILNYLFVGVMKLEALGLALAPSLGLWVYFLIQVPGFMRKDAPMHFSVRGIKWNMAWDIIKIGVPGAAGNAYRAVRGAAVNSLIIASVGAVGISAYTAANSLLSLFWIIPDGMLVVSRMMISVSVGEEDRKSLTEVMRTALFNFIPILVALALAIMLLAEPLTRLYYRDPSDPVYMMTMMGFRILPWCMPLSIIMSHFSCYWQASDRHIPVHILALLDGLIGTVVFSMLLIGSMGLSGVYTATVLNGLISPVFVWIYACIYKKGFPKNLEELMPIPEDFGVPVNGRIDITLHNMDSVIGISSTLQEFCQERGIDRRRAFFSSLFIEEMAGNVIKHGFSADKKKHHLQVCVACRTDTLILSLKDDCVPFNIEQRSRMMDQEDKTKNIGIRIVSGVASEIHYQNILGLNVLSIRLNSQAGI